ncbi:MAG: flagellar motor switch protein FliN [Candidatus Velthaea sp.]
MEKSSADAMFASAADVLGTLVDRAVTAAPCEGRSEDNSIRVDPLTVATLTEIPSAGFSFVTQYDKAALGQVVALMLGTPAGEGEMDAMQLSIVTETVAQVSSAMAERLTQQLKVASENIVSTVPTEAGAFPAPPFSSYRAVLDVAGEFSIDVALDFDGVALGKIEPKPEPAPPPPPPPPAARAAAPAPQSRPVAFAPLPPTPIRAAPPGKANLDLVHDIPLEISAVLGQTAMSLRDVVALQSGSVLELDKLSSDPIDLYVNDILIARGEVVVVDDKFAIKISELNPAIDKV